MFIPAARILSYLNTSLFLDILLRVLFSFPVNLVIMAFLVLGPIACAVMELLACKIASFKATTGNNGLTRTASGVVRATRKKKSKESFLPKLENALTFKVSGKELIRTFFVGKPWHLQNDTNWVDIKDTLFEAEVITESSEHISDTARAESMIATACTGSTVKKFTYDSPRTPIKKISRVLRVLDPHTNPTKATILTITIDESPLGKDFCGDIMGREKTTVAPKISTEPDQSLPTTPTRLQEDARRGRRSPNLFSAGPSSNTRPGTPTCSSAQFSSTRSSIPLPTRSLTPTSLRNNNQSLARTRCSSPPFTRDRNAPKSLMKLSPSILIPTLRHHSLLSTQAEQTTSPPSTPITPIKRGNSFSFLPHSPTSPSTTKVDEKHVAVTSNSEELVSKLPIKKRPKVKRG